jgi:hypothetical protein
MDPYSLVNLMFTYLIIKQEKRECFLIFSVIQMKESVQTICIKIISCPGGRLMSSHILFMCVILLNYDSWKLVDITITIGGKSWVQYKGS